MRNSTKNEAGRTPHLKRKTAYSAHAEHVSLEGVIMYFKNLLLDSLYFNFE